MQHYITAIILMGGKGERFGSAKPKQFHRLSGKPVFMHTLEAFVQSELFHEILLVCPKDWTSEVHSHLEKISGSLPIKVILGGDSRRESSLAGLYGADPLTTHVVIHDAVRPFISQRILQENVQGAIEFGAVDTCIASSDTIVHSVTGDTIDDIPQRSHYLRGQTPQSFKLSMIKQAHALQEDITEITDDCSLVTRLGGTPIHIVRGEESNIKITTELDLYLAEQILRLPITALQNCEDTSFAGKTYVITGASGGIGSSIAKALTEKGAHVLSVSRNAKEFPADLSDAAQAEKVFIEIHQKYGPIDGLINSVGSLIHRPFHSLSSKEIQDLVENNLSSLLYCCRYAIILPQGHIINIASSSYSKGRKDYAVYSATKAAVVNFTQGLAEEMPHHYVNVLAPQRTLTPLRLLHFPSDPLEALMPASQVAAAALELLSQSKTTGAIIEVRKKESSSISKSFCILPE
ncbi:MAG: D-ribitol-5-phosphate cytidylyltransferase [Chlamydiae bacterium]|nr:D-ribitol-5-phosphate cytidylyltransferase [Chlamydiota bacterium]